MNGELFTLMSAALNNEVSEDHLLADIANQVRLGKFRMLLGEPVVTPYDVFRSYRDQNERIGAKIVEMPVDAFLSKVSEPSATEVQALFDKYKDVLPDPARETPGFKIPRRIQIEILSLDGEALARGLRDKVTEADLRSYYENHKSEFEVPLELPVDLFADQPELTPPIIQAFSEVRGILAPRLAEEKAQAEIVDKFTQVKEAEMIPFADKYLAALDDQEEAKKQGGSSNGVLPTPQDLKPVADREGFHYEKTALISQQDAERLGQISTAEVGLTPLSGGRKFVDEMFDPKTGLFEPVELTDVLGTRFLVRKIKDEPPHVPTLDQVRSDVIVAWKMAQARPSAEKAARELAKPDQGQGCDHQGFAGRWLSSAERSSHHRSQMSFPTMTRMDSAVIETPIPDVPQAGEAFRDAYFGLRSGAVEVAPNQPGTVYYVMTLDRREPVTFAALYAPNGDEYRYQMMARELAAKQQDESGWLAAAAGRAEVGLDSPGRGQERRGRQGLIRTTSLPRLPSHPETPRELAETTWDARRGACGRSRE